MATSSMVSFSSFSATVAGFIVAAVASSIRLIAAALAGKTDPLRAELTPKPTDTK